MPERREAVAMDASPVKDELGVPVEAARYALLRRLAPALRHGMVGALHPMELIAEAIEQRLQAAAPDLANVGENLGRIKNLARSAIVSCTALAGWLAPEEGVDIMLGEGIDECLALLKADFSMRGFAVRNEAREIGVDVSRAALRNVMTAALIAATDEASRPADLVLTAELARGRAVLSILVRPADGVAGFTDAAAYRRLEWSDVGALAQAESVELLHQGDRVTMRFPIAGSPQSRELTR
jgi:hypothetical protein